VSKGISSYLAITFRLPAVTGGWRENRAYSPSLFCSSKKISAIFRLEKYRLLRTSEAFWIQVGGDFL